MASHTPACIHRIHDDNIQEFVLTEVSRRALDDLFNLSEAILSEVSAIDLSYTAIPVLIDSRVGLQSINHGLIRMRALVAKFPARRQGRVALVLPSNPLIKTIGMLLRPLAPVHVYEPHEREKALAWLRESVLTAMPSL